MIRRATFLASALTIALAAPAAAQNHGHGGHGATGPTPPAVAHDFAAPPASTATLPEPEAINDVSPASAAPVAAPRVPTDHAADRFYDPRLMAQARRRLAYESGGMPASMLYLRQFELRAGRGANAYRWEGEAFYGGDLDRLWLKSEGEWDSGRRLEDAEAQALYSRAIAPYFNLQAGVRHDFRPRGQTYLAVAIEGLAPYWFDVESELFVSTKGDVLARAEASYDQRITQRLVLQPQIELNFAAQDVRDSRIGRGLTDVDAGLRLRYEIAPNVAPYVGLVWERDVGRTARLARRAGERAQGARLVAGMRVFL